MAGGCAGSIKPASTSGRISAMAQVDQQPGFVSRAAGADRVALAGRHLGEAEAPVGMGAVGGGGVDDPCREAGVVRDRDDLLRRRIGQAEDRHLGLGKGGKAGGNILPQRRVDADERDVFATFQSLADLQTRRADIPIDEDLVCHRSAPFRKARPIYALGVRSKDQTPGRDGSGAVGYSGGQARIRPICSSLRIT